MTTEFLKKRREIRYLRLGDSVCEEIRRDLDDLVSIHWRRSAALIGYRAMDDRIELSLEMETGRLLSEELTMRGDDGGLSEVEALRLGRELLLAQIEARQSGYLFTRIAPQQVLLRVEADGQEMTGGAKLVFPPLREGAWWAGSNNPAYVSLEELDLENGVCDYRSTCYSIGAVLFFALNGCDPQKSDDGSIDWKEMKGLSSETNLLFARMSAGRPEERCGSLEVLCEEFSNLLRERAKLKRERRTGRGMVFPWLRGAAAL